MYICTDAMPKNFVISLKPVVYFFVNILKKKKSLVNKNNNDSSCWSGTLALRLGQCCAGTEWNATLRCVRILPVALQVIKKEASNLR